MIAACLLIAVALGSYKLGSSHPVNVAAQLSTTTSPHPNVERELQELRTSLQDAKRKEEALQERATQQEADLDRAHEDATAAQARLEAELSSEASTAADSVSKLRAITDERNAAMAKVQDAELTAKNAQDELYNFRFQRKQDETKIATLESQVGGLNVALNLQKQPSEG